MTASPDLQASTPEPASVLDGKYRLDAPLGEGAVGLVYRATHLGLKKVFAVKLLKPGPTLDPFSVSRFRREAEALGRLRHPHVVEVTDFGVDPGTGSPYLVMELLDGVPLSKLCRNGPLPLARALPILDAMAAAIDAAHEQRILHRDLKPGNVLLCGTGGKDPSVKVLDFGLAEISAPPPPIAAVDGEDLVIEQQAGSLTATGALLGTPLYVAPEVIRQGRACRASDVYSFGVIAYEMLAGRPPFKGSTREVLAGHLAGEPAPGALSAEVWNALRASLAKNPAGRPATAREVVRRLRAAAGREDRRRWRRTEAPRRALLAALLAAAVPVAGLLLNGLPAVERWVCDLRLRAAPALLPDPRILLVTLDEASLADRSVPLADRADEVGNTLDRIFAAGARGVAVDLLLPESWSTSRGFSDLVLRHSGSLTLAAFSEPDGSVLGIGSVGGLTAAALGPGRAGSLFGFVNLDEDADGMIRHGRLGFRDRAGGRRPSWAARAAEMISPLPAHLSEEGFWIDHRIDASRFTRISWRDLPAALKERPWTFRHRLVLLGGDVVAAGDDVNRVPRRPSRSGTVSGLVLQALLINTIVGGLPLREAPRAPFLLGAALWTGLAAAAALLARRPIPLLAALVVVLLAEPGLSIPVFQRTGLLWPVTAPLLPALLALGLALVLRRRLSPIP
ncbi:MAG TPA: protein kinase [Thermoanaerobaculia bacterium]|jgi:CHASE2 domain-containing sensor protein/tRNA A-37 threonylcarbamoyl transferase component Bud32|nr:protein kinase [Thermoanaerobaculia bacterium]